MESNMSGRCPGPCWGWLRSRRIPSRVISWLLYSTPAVGLVMSSLALLSNLVIFCHLCTCSLKRKRKSRKPEKFLSEVLPVKTQCRRMGCARKPRAGGVREDFLAQHSMECVTLVSIEQDHFIGWVSYFFFFHNWMSRLHIYLSISWFIIYWISNQIKFGSVFSHIPSWNLTLFVQQEFFFLLPAHKLKNIR